jgi:hypothetical protein
MRKLFFGTHTLVIPLFYEVRISYGLKNLEKTDVLNISIPNMINHDANVFELWTTRKRKV